MLVALVSHVPVVSILIALVVTALIVLVIEWLGVPRPISWIVGLLIFLALAFG